MSTEEFVQAVPEAEVITEGILFSLAFVIITIISYFYKHPDVKYVIKTFMLDILIVNL